MTQGETVLCAIAEAVLASSRADETEVIVSTTEAALTRFANNAIHQNVAERDSTITVRVALGRRLGVASVNRASLESGREALDRALAIAAVQPENPDFDHLAASPRAASTAGFAATTARCSPQRRAAPIAEICRLATDAGVTAAGAYRTTTDELLVANSAGTRQYHAGTAADLTVVAMGPDSSGYADRLAIDIDSFDAVAAGREAIERALAAAHPQPIEPGEYTVVLLPYAVSDLVDFLAYLGFSGLAVHEGRSFMSGKFGQLVLGPNITIRDAGSDPAGLPSPFDYEGVPRQALPLIESGVARAVVYDSITAHKDHTVSTGHALPPGETFGPVPLNLFFEPADLSLEDLIGGVDHGLLVTRFWYTRPVHPLHVIVTGMTRDGLFRIEHGELGPPVRDMRFTQGYLDALRQVSGVGRETSLERSMFAANRVPAVRIDGFRFVSGTGD